MTDEVASESISLPIWSHMDDATVGGICESIERARAYAKEVREALTSRQREMGHSASP